MLYPSGQRDQHVIPGGMAQGVVDLLEAITIEVEQREALVMQPARSDRLIQTSLKQSTIGQAGQGIVGGWCSRLAFSRRWWACQASSSSSRELKS